MTGFNVVGAMATVSAPHSAPAADGSFEGGASFGAVLDQVLQASQAAAAPAAADGTTAVASPSRESSAPATAVVSPPRESSTPATTRPAPVDEFADLDPTAALPPEAEDGEDTPTLAEVLLPIEALASFLAAFIVLSNSTLASDEASREAAATDVEGITAAAAPVGANGVTPAIPLDDMAVLSQLAGGPPEAGDGLGDLLSSLFGEPDGQPVPDLAELSARPGMAELIRELADALPKADALTGVPLGTAAPATTATRNLGAIVDALLELASQPVDGGEAAEGDEADQAGSRLDQLARAIESGQSAPTADLARLVATLTQELSAASGPAPESADATAAAGPSRETDQRVLVALAGAAEQLEAGQVSGSSRVTVQLEPVSLGKVTIEVERTSEGVVARVVAASDAARQAIAQDLGAVQDALTAIGVPVTSVEVSGPEGAPTQDSGFEVLLDAARPDAPAPTAEEAADASASTVLTGGATRPAAVEGQVSSPPAATPSRAGVANLVRDIGDQAGVLLSQGKSEFQIQLRPQELGRLLVRMTLEAGEVTVSMRAESAATRNAIESSLSQLKQSFQEQGIRVDRFEVLTGQGQLAHDQGHPRRSRGWVDQVRSRSADREDGDFAGTLAAAVRPVDYRA